MIVGTDTCLKLVANTKDKHDGNPTGRTSIAVSA